MKGYATAMMERYPKYAKRPRALLPRLAYDLTFAKAPSRALDDRLYKAMKRYLPRLEPARYTLSFDLALLLLPANWWWHASHLETKVIPTSPVKGAEAVLSNAGRYDDEGHPIGYTTMIAWDYNRLPLAMCASIVSAVAALQKLARTENRK